MSDHTCSFRQAPQEKTLDYSLRISLHTRTRRDDLCNVFLAASGIGFFLWILLYERCPDRVSIQRGNKLSSSRGNLARVVDAGRTDFRDNLYFCDGHVQNSIRINDAVSYCDDRVDADKYLSLICPERIDDDNVGIIIRLMGYLT